MHKRLSFRAIVLFCAIACSATGLLLPGHAAAQTVGTAVGGTLGDYDKPNQNRAFYHDGTWWLAARISPDKNWHLWKLNGTTWQQDLLLTTESNARPDCYLNATSGKLYVTLSDNSNSMFLRASYVNGSWQVDTGYPSTIPSFAHDGENPVSMAIDATGGIWLFRILTSTLQALHSTDEGLTWSQIITVKSSLNSQKGLADGVAFSINGTHYVGVAYGENTSANAQFGFLIHIVGQSASNWTDETPLMGQFAGTEADDHIAAATDGEGRVFIVTKTDGGGSTVAANGFYKREPGGWEKHPLNLDSGWTRPAIAIDSTNGDIYAMGTLTNDPKIGVYKRVNLGDEDRFATATPVTIFQNSSDQFKNLSVSASPAHEAIGLMVLVENNTQDNVWYNKIDIVRFNRPPTAVASATPDSGKAPLQVTFRGEKSFDPDGSVVAWEWDFGDGIGTSTDVNQQYRYFTAGTFTATLVVTDNKGKKDTASVVVEVAPQIRPVARLTATPQTGKPPLLVQFNGSGSTDQDGVIAAYSWNFGDGSPLSAEANPSHSFANLGVYNVSLIVTDDCGLTDTATVTITVNPPQAPNAVAAVNKQPGKVDVPLQFTGSQSSDMDGTIVSYAWDMGDGTQYSIADPEHTYTTTGEYTVSLTVTDDDGMQDSATLAMTINTSARPTAVASATPDSGAAPITVQFTGTASTDPDGVINKYAWVFGDGRGSSASPNPVYTYEGAGEFLARLIVTDNDGLLDTAWVQVKVLGNSRPVAQIRQPATDTTMTPGTILAFKGTAQDAEEGELPPNSYIWTLINPANSSTIIALAVQQGSIRLNQLGTYKLVLEARDSPGLFGSDTVRIEVTNTTPVVDRDGGLPNGFALFEAFPNPYQPGATRRGDGLKIRFALPKAQHVSVSIFNALGQEIAVLLENEARAPGEHTLRWNGQDLSGRRVPRGLYFVQVRSASGRAVRKLMVLRQR